MIKIQFLISLMHIRITNILKCMVKNQQKIYSDETKLFGLFLFLRFFDNITL